MSEMAKIAAICNQKDGVGKTVTAVNLGIGLAPLRSESPPNSLDVDFMYKSAVLVLIISRVATHAL